MMGWISRYRHGRGFGVHSPFAYRLITEVLHEKLPYYDWDRVKGRHERMLYRLACRFIPQSVSAPDALASVVKMACPRSVTAPPDRASMVVMDSGTDPAAAIAALRPGTILVVFGRHHKKLLDSLSPTLTAMGYGMTFDNERDTAIIVADPKLPLQTFKAGV